MLVITFALCLLAFPPTQNASNQSDKQAQLRANLESKLAKRFVKAGGWELDFDKACRRASEENKLIFVYFTRTFAP